MPLKLYCPSCSQPNEYTLTKPLFCGMCGAKFASLAEADIKKHTINRPINKPINKPIVSVPLAEDEEIDDEGIGNEELDISISSLQLETPIDSQKEKGVKFGEVAKQQKTGFVREKPKKINKKKEFELFLEGAKNTRKPIEVEDNSRD